MGKYYVQFFYIYYTAENIDKPLKVGLKQVYWIEVVQGVE